MTAAKRIYELVKALPADKVSEILDFVEFLYQKQELQSQVTASAAIPPGTLTRLSDIAKLSLAERHQIRLCRKYFLVTNEVSRSRSVKR